MSKTSVEMARRLDDDLLQLPTGSRLVQVAGSRPDLRVWMREIRQHDTPATFGMQPNPPVYVYETAAAFMDRDKVPNPAEGLPTVRAGLFEEPDDTERLAGLSSEYARGRAKGEPGEARFPGRRAPRRDHAGNGVRRNS